MARSILFFILSFPLCAHSQLLNVYNATITIANGTQIHVNGATRTAGSSVLNNEGTLYITGDLDHDATGTCFGPSQGTVIMNGGDQAIDGNSMPVFNNLVLAGTGTKQLLRDVQVGGSYLAPQGVLLLNDRLLDLNSHTLTVLNGNSDAIQRTTGFIVSETDPITGYGRVTWNIGQQAVPGDVFTFPFGNAATSTYLPFAATITDPGMGVNGWLSMATYPTDPAQTPNNRPLPAGMTTLTNPANLENAPFCLDRWWIMETGGYSQAPLADLQFHYRDSEWNSGTNMIMEDGLILQDRFNGTWNYPPSTVASAIDRLSTTARPFRNSEWTASSMLSPLPIELLTFEGERISQNKVLLRWSTATERNNAGFEVWRLVEGEADFQFVGWVDGAGDSQTTLQYELIDPNEAKDVSYYFLKQIDHDGTATNSPMISIDGTGTAADLSIYPNPAHTHFSIRSSIGVVNVQLLDGLGQIAKQFSFAESYPVDDLPGGVYVVRCLLQDGNTTSQRLVVE